MPCAAPITQLPVSKETNDILVASTASHVTSSASCGSDSGAETGAALAPEGGAKEGRRAGIGLHSRCSSGTQPCEPSQQTRSEETAIRGMQVWLGILREFPSV